MKKSGGGAADAKTAATSGTVDPKKALNGGFWGSSTGYQETGSSGSLRVRTSGGHGQATLVVRNEPFDYGHLGLGNSIPRYSEGPQILKAIRKRLLQIDDKTPNSAGTVPSKWVAVSTVASALGMSSVNTQVLLETLAAIDEHAIVSATAAFSDSNLNYGRTGNSAPGSSQTGSRAPSHADAYALLLLLVVQFYHKPRRVDSLAMADHWPAQQTHGSSPKHQAHPFDALVSGGSPHAQQGSPGGLRMPRQSIDRDGQLSFLRQNIGLVLDLIKTPGGGIDENNITAADLDRIGFLIRAEDGSSISRLAPAFANSDVAPLEEIRLWLTGSLDGKPVLQRSMSNPSTSPAASIAAAAAAAAAASLAAAASPLSAAGGKSDGMSVDQSADSGARSGTWDGCVYIDGLSKSLVVREEADMEDARSLRVADCHDTVVYVLAPIQYASVTGCTDCTVLIGSVGKVLKVGHCERLQLIAAGHRVSVSNCRDCTFFLGVNERPIFLGENRHIQLAPYNTFYPRLDSHLQAVGVDPKKNAWDSPVGITQNGQESDMDEGDVVDGVNRKDISSLSPDKFVPFIVPFRGKEGATPASSSASLGSASPQTSTTSLDGTSGVGSAGSLADIANKGGGSSGSQSARISSKVTRVNPFTLPPVYASALEAKVRSVSELRQAVREAGLEESRKRELQNVIQAYFKEWLQTSGNLRQVYDLAKYEKTDI